MFLSAKGADDESSQLYEQLHFSSCHHPTNTTGVYLWFSAVFLKKLFLLIIHSQCHGSALLRTAACVCLNSCWLEWFLYKEYNNFFKVNEKHLKKTLNPVLVLCVFVCIIWLLMLDRISLMCSSKYAMILPFALCVAYSWHVTRPLCLSGPGLWEREAGRDSRSHSGYAGHIYLRTGKASCGRGSVFCGPFSYLMRFEFLAWSVNRQILMLSLYHWLFFFGNLQIYSHMQ